MVATHINGHSFWDPWSDLIWIGSIVDTDKQFVQPKIHNGCHGVGITDGGGWPIGAQPHHLTSSRYHIVNMEAKVRNPLKFQINMGHFRKLKLLSKYSNLRPNRHCVDPHVKREFINWAPGRNYSNNTILCHIYWILSNNNYI